MGEFKQVIKTCKTCLSWGKVMFLETIRKRIEGGQRDLSNHGAKNHFCRSGRRQMLILQMPILKICRSIYWLQIVAKFK